MTKFIVNWGTNENNQDSICVEAHTREEARLIGWEIAKEEADRDMWSTAFTVEEFADEVGEDVEIIRDAFCK